MSTNELATESAERVRENRLRRVAARQGWRLTKVRHDERSLMAAKPWRLEWVGPDSERTPSGVALPERWTLDEVAGFLGDGR